MENIINLKRFRQKFNITQAAAAESIGIDQRQWNRYENGINEIPVRYLKAICQQYNVSADWVLEINNKANEIEKSCHNCQDYIVCYGMNTIEEDKGQNCPNWHLDFMEFQKLLENTEQ